MKYEWIGKNVDLDRLTDSIEHFLNSKRFKSHGEEGETSRRVLGILRSADGGFRKVVVTVSGCWNDFTVELKVGVQNRSILKLGSLISFFGGGSLLLKGYRSAQWYSEFEEEFWKHVQTVISHIAESAESSS